MRRMSTMFATTIAVAATVAAGTVITSASASASGPPDGQQAAFSIGYTFMPSPQRDLTFSVKSAPITQFCIRSQSHTPDLTEEVPKGGRDDAVRRQFEYSLVANHSSIACSVELSSFQEWRVTINNGRESEILDVKLTAREASNVVTWNQFRPGGEDNPIIFVTRKRNGLAVVVYDTSPCTPDPDPLHPLPPSPLPCPGTTTTTPTLFGSS